MEGRCVGNCLNVFVWVQIVVCPWNGGELSVVQIRNRLLKDSGIDVGIIRTAAVTRPPAGVDRQLHQARKPQLSAGSCRGAALQHAERFHIHGVGALRNKICIQEILMTHLVVGDVMNVLREIGINSPQRLGIESIAASSRSFVVPESAQFIILGVKVSLEGFSRSQEL